VKRRPARPFLLLCAAAAALTGCGDGGAPPQTLPPLTSPATAGTTASATPTPSPTSSATDLRRSAERFVRAYYVAYDRAFHTADSSALASDFYSKDCRVCTKNVEILDEFRRKEQHFKDYEFVIRGLEVGGWKGNTIVATVVLHHASGRIVRDSDGSTVQTLSATTPVKSDLILARLDSEWRITEIVSRGRAQQ